MALGCTVADLLNGQASIGSNGINKGFVALGCTVADLPNGQASIGSKGINKEGVELCH